ncbi:MAG: TlpA family protein disulfide reductase [Candidatus Heimdallarchaeota archaeon]|nr:TlpA family protein disulfide reductase [Candidatus Heimdallarchaeota archaeon]
MAKKRISFATIIPILILIQTVLLTQSYSIVNHPTHDFSPKLKPIGTPGKDWTLKDVLSDTQITFSSYAGRVVLLDFFATWCQPCKIAMAEFAEVKSHFRSSELVIISISTDVEPESTLESYAAANGITWKLVIDTISLSDYYEVISIPTIYIFDLDQKVGYADSGVKDASTLIQVINLFLDDDSTTQPSNNHEPTNGFWAKNWYWFGILLVFIIIAVSIYIQRQRVIQYNKKVREERLARARKNRIKRRR